MEFVDIGAFIVFLGICATVIVQPGWLPGWLKKKEDPIAVERRTYEKLKENLALQKERADNVVKIVQRREAALAEKKQKAAEVEREYLETPKEKRDAAFEADVSARYARVNAAVEEATVKLAEARKLAEEAETVLNETFESVQEFEEKFESDQGNADLAAAHRINAEAKEQAKGIRTTLTAAGQASRDVAIELETGRAASELAKGSKTDQDRAALAKGADASDALASLRQLASKAEEVIIEVPAATDLLASKDHS